MTVPFYFAKPEFSALHIGSRNISIVVSKNVAGDILSLPHAVAVLRSRSISRSSSLWLRRETDRTPSIQLAPRIWCTGNSFAAALNTI